MPSRGVAGSGGKATFVEGEMVEEPAVAAGGATPQPLVRRRFVSHKVGSEGSGAADNGSGGGRCDDGSAEPAVDSGSGGDRAGPSSSSWPCARLGFPDAQSRHGWCECGSAEAGAMDVGEGDHRAGVFVIHREGTCEASTSPVVPPPALPLGSEPLEPPVEIFSDVLPPCCVCGYVG